MQLFLVRPSAAPSRSHILHRLRKAMEEDSDSEGVGRKEEACKMLLTKPMGVPFPIQPPKGHIGEVLATSEKSKIPRSNAAARSSS